MGGPPAIVSQPFHEMGCVSMDIGRRRSRFAATRLRHGWKDRRSTRVRTWAGFCYVEFVEDVSSRMIVGW